MREGGREGGTEGGREGGKEGRMEGGKEGRREGGKEGRREGGKEGRRGKEAGMDLHPSLGGRESGWDGWKGKVERERERYGG